MMIGVRYRTVVSSAVVAAATACVVSCTPAGAPDDTETVRSAVNSTVVVTVRDQAGAPIANSAVRAVRGTNTTQTWADTNASGQATFSLPANSYYFEVSEDGSDFLSGAVGHCTTPACTTAQITITRVDVTVVNTAGTPQVGQEVFWVTSTEEGGWLDTDASGHALIAVPAGSYQFVATQNTWDFTSGSPGHCTVPSCSSVTITTTVPVAVTVRNTLNVPQPNLRVEWEDALGEDGGWIDTDANGVSLLSAPVGSYRFLVFVNNVEFASGPANHCVVPGCTSAQITVSAPLAVTVRDTAGTPITGKAVWWETAGGDSGSGPQTNASGVSNVVPPAEPVRFRVTVDGTDFYSSQTYHCTQPACTSATITVSQQTVVTVVNGSGTAISGRAVTPLSDEGITSGNKTTNTSGQATFRLPFGHWRFRATCSGSSEQFFSGNAGHCFTTGGCTTATIRMPCGVCTGVANNPPTACDDGNPCTLTSTCQNQRCVAGTARTCTASDQCHDVGACGVVNATDWACSNPNKTDGTTCNDNNACTQTSTCQTGVCTGANPVTCSASDQCHDAGTCNPATGCSNPAKANGTACNDGSLCTQSDSCQSGACVGASPVVCAAQDQCHVAGTCNPATGVCSASPRVADGTACSDGNRCSSGDSCRAGTCLPGTSNTCAGTGQPNYVSVIEFGSLQGYSYAGSINNNGVVVGTDTINGDIYRLGYAGTRSFRWTESEGMVYLPWTGPAIYAVDINDAGAMAVIGGPPGGGTLPCRYDPAVDAQPVCQTSAGGSHAINAAGIMTGGIYTPLLRPFRLGTGALELLPPADMMGVGFSIADDGTVIGVRYVGPNNDSVFVRYTDARGTEDVEDLLPANSGWTVGGASVSRPGEILGWGYRNGYGRAFRMKTNASGDITQISELPMPPNYGAESPRVMIVGASNASNELAGSVYDTIPYWPAAAVVYADAVGTVDLNTLIDPQSGWNLKATFAINDNHEVVGYGDHNGVQRGYKLKLPPTSPCPPQDSCHTGVRDLLTGTCSYTAKPTGAACDDGNACTRDDACNAAGVCAGQSTVACVAPNTCKDAGTCIANHPPAPPPSTQDLVGWWKLDGDGVDSSGGGHNLTIEGGVTSAPGRVGMGMKFDGASCMTAPIWPEARMQGAPGVTMMAWVRPDDFDCPAGQTGRSVMGRGWDYSIGSWCWPGPLHAISGGGRPAGWQTWGWGGGFGQVHPGEWAHATVTWDQNQLLIYLNGVPSIHYEVGANGFGDGEELFGIGCMASNYYFPGQRALFFHGTIDEVMLYRRVLSPAEVAAYYAAADPCDHPVHANGSACNDSDLCTQTDTCQTGTCVGGNPVTCVAQDGCHTAGTCAPGTGVCSNPVGADGVACSDAQPCMSNGTCQAGSCRDTSISADHACVMPADTRVLASAQVGSAVLDPFWTTAYDRIDARTGIGAVRATVTSQCGFDPFTDFDSCLFAFDDVDGVINVTPTNFLALCGGHWDRGLLEACMRVPRPGGEPPFEWSGVEVLGGDKRPFLALLRDDLLAIGSRDWITEAIDRYLSPTTPVPPDSPRGEVVRLAGFTDSASTTWIAGLVGGSSLTAGNTDFRAVTGMTVWLDLRAGLTSTFRFEAGSEASAASLGQALMTTSMGDDFPTALTLLGIPLVSNTPQVSGAVVTTISSMTPAQLFVSLDRLFPPGGAP